MANSKPFEPTVGDGKSTLKYLAPYVYRVAISDNRILSVTDTHITYRFTPSDTKQSVTRTVTGEEFVRGFLQHVVPSRLLRIRYYGFLSQNSKLSIGYVRMRVWFYRGWCYWLAKPKQDEPPTTRPIICVKCGAEMELLAITNASGAVLWPKPKTKQALAQHPKGHLDTS